MISNYAIVKVLVKPNVKYRVEDQTRYKTWTGFLLDYQENLLWVTAGHVIDDMNRVLSNPKVNVQMMRWLDGCQIPGAESVVVHNHNFKRFSAMNTGLDLGTAIIAGLDKGCILAGGRVEILTEKIWKDLRLAQPKGYYILGAPDEWVEVTSFLLSDNRTQYKCEVKLSILPVSRIEYRGPDSTTRFWDDSGAFYGQILPFVDDPSRQPEDIGGMSGAPLLSIEVDPKGELRYRLFGILRSWNEGEKLIRVEPISRIVKELSKIIKEQ